MQLFEVGFAHVHFHDLPLAIDEVGGGGDADLVKGFCYGALHIKGHIKWQLSALGKVADVGEVVVLHGHRNCAKALLAILLVSFNQFGHFFDACAATGGPEVHEQHLASVLCRCNNGAIDARKVNQRG
jgi:hypothetical protein